MFQSTLNWRLTLLAIGLTSILGATAGLLPNPRFLPSPTSPNQPAHYSMVGNVTYGDLGDPSREYSGKGVRLQSCKDPAAPGPVQGSVTTTARDFGANRHRWYRFRIRALAQRHFSVEKDDLYLQVEFYGKGGTDALDKIKQRIFPQVRQERTDLADRSTSEKLGPATWRTYEMEFRTPFAEVDTLRLSAGFTHGNATELESEFWINDFQLDPIAPPKHFRSKEAPISSKSIESLIHLGGRWYYDPSHLGPQVPREFNHRNANRLLYLSDKLEAPFVDNTSAWLRDGYYDATGTLVKKSRYIPDNVVIRFTQQHLVIQSHNLPNHPTAFFPDIWRALDGNPNHIQEMASVWYIPLQPTPNPNRISMTQGNQNNALPGGPIGVAVNGIVFFNPYDLERTEDAIWRLDRCCGHPAPNSQYHYHKYPVCIKSPWADNGERHSPLIGFAFDGFPIYGPYEAPNLLAKNASSNPLNEFNVHRDEARGWHYHVTPGKFPHIIGGYFGTLDPNNRRGRGNRAGPRGPGRRRSRR